MPSRWDNRSAFLLRPHACGCILPFSTDRQPQNFCDIPAKKFRSSRRPSMSKRRKETKTASSNTWFKKTQSQRGILRRMRAQMTSNPSAPIATAVANQRAAYKSSDSTRPWPSTRTRYITGARASTDMNALPLTRESSESTSEFGSSSRAHVNPTRRSPMLFSSVSARSMWGMVRDAIASTLERGTRARRPGSGGVQKEHLCRPSQAIAPRLPMTPTTFDPC
mmetsp:Transcript_43733/g.109140  ORF Transcript_43733/g.109140 Transcript_43733/m.109140 type:complete len:222 (+) Transcript_43733:1183-1848(+)